MSAATPLFSPTLESVQQAFDQWRSTRVKRSRTPISLRRRAVALRDGYPASHICRALKINDTALKHWAQEASITTQRLPVPSMALIELSAESAAPIHAEAYEPPTGSISIELGNALQLHVQGSFTLAHILTAVSEHQSGAGS